LNTNLDDDLLKLKKVFRNLELFIGGLSKALYLEIGLKEMDYSKAGRNMVADLMSK
jgi:hypothetical protein